MNKFKPGDRVVIIRDRGCDTCRVGTVLTIEHIIKGDIYSVEENEHIQREDDLRLISLKEIMDGKI